MGGYSFIFIYSFRYHYMDAQDRNESDRVSVSDIYGYTILLKCRKFCPNIARVLSEIRTIIKMFKN